MARSIPRALAASPRLLLLDEPAGGLTHSEVDELTDVIRRIRDSLGLTVLLVEQHKLPVVAASLYVLRGSEANPAQLPGLAAFTADMLDEGTTTRASLKLADDVAQIGATLTAGSSSDASSASITALRRNADAAFDLLADVVQHPAFAPAEIERLRNQRLTDLLQQNDDPRALAARRPGSLHCNDPQRSVAGSAEAHFQVSPSRHTAARSRVREWQWVTVRDEPPTFPF